MTDQWWTGLPAVQVTAQIASLLLTRHAPPEWATFEEFHGGTGTSRWSDRAIDVLAVHLWRDRRASASGPHVVAYEIKASRGDFARELKDPDKRAAAEAIATECLFAVPVGLVKPEEVPEAWGLLEVMRNRRTRVAKHAQQRKIETWPWPVVRSMARRVNRKECPEVEGTDGRVRPDRLLLWRIAGLDMTEEEVAEVVRQHYQWQIDQVSKMERSMVIEEWLDGNADYARLVEVDQAVRRITGRYKPTGDNLAKWIQEHAGQSLTPETRRLAASLRDALDALIGGEG